MSPLGLFLPAKVSAQVLLHLDALCGCGKESS